MEICRIEDCNNKVKIKNVQLCATHYEKWRTRDKVETRVCTYKDCKNPWLSSGFCRLHYYRNKDGRNMDGLREVKLCTFGDCTNKFYAKGLCHNHYEMSRRPRGLAGRELAHDYECEFPGCDRRSATVKLPRLCNAHYMQNYVGTEMRPIRQVGPRNRWIDGHKICPGCNRNLSKEHYYYNRTGPNRAMAYRSYCKQCVIKQTLARKRAKENA